MGVDAQGTCCCVYTDVLQPMETTQKSAQALSTSPSCPCSCTRVFKATFKYLSIYTVPLSPSPLLSSGESKSCSTAAASVHLPVPQLQKPLCLQLEVTSSLWVHLRPRLGMVSADFSLLVLQCTSWPAFLRSWYQEESLEKGKEKVTRIFYFHFANSTWRQEVQGLR